MITLQHYHKELIIDALEAIVQYKSRALRKSSWFKFETEYLPKAIEQIKTNTFTVNDTKNNFFVWFIDNLCHCRVVIDGVPVNDGVPLIDTRLGEQVAKLCRVCSKGQKYYTEYYTGSRFNDLFEYA